MTSAQTNIDQITYWNGDAGRKWTNSQERLDRMLAGISAELLRTAQISSGEHILDVGCGCGETTLALAAIGAKPVGIDISAPMLARARERAPSIEFIEADAAAYDFKKKFDLVFSRFGVMFFANPDEAFTNLHNALRKHGRLAFACWRDWKENEWVRIPVSAVRPLVPPQPQLGPEDPGPFSFADVARVRRILSNAGFDQIEIKPFDTQLQLGEGLDDALAHVQEIGPVSRMLADASPSQRENANNVLRSALTALPVRKPFTMGGAIWIVTAKASTQ